LSELAFAPDGSALYAATYGAGVLKSSDGGDAWQDMSEGLESLYVASIAVDPAEPLTLYAGRYAGNDVYRSTNGGASWEKVGQGLPAGSVLGLAIDPTDTDTLYAATENGAVYRSENEGEDWEPAGEGLPEDWVWQLTHHPSQPGTLYAGTEGYGLYRTTNGGESWQPVALELADQHVSEVKIGPEPGHPVYVASSGGLWRSSNNGEDWDLLMEGDVTGVALDPMDPERIYAAAGLAYVSHDGGSSWIQLAQGLPSAFFSDLEADPTDASLIVLGTYGQGAWAYELGAAQGLFEGWNQLPAWPGGAIDGPGAIVAALDAAVSSAGRGAAPWQSIAWYDGAAWLQTFAAAPLPSFNTLTAIEPGEDYWLFVTQDATLLFPF
jgi:photosystem II stability/assembly factor-like uncharacterized protein